MRRIERARHRLSGTMVAAIFWLAACRQPSPQKFTPEYVVQRYLTLASELGERDPDSLDFYVPRNGPQGGSPESPPSLEMLHTEAIKLRDDLVELRRERSIDPVRRQFLSQQVESLLFRIEQLQGRQRSFNEESRALFGVEVAIDSGEAERRNIRKQLGQVLGNPKSPAVAYSKYDAQFVVPRARVPAVLSAALQRCRELTLQHLALPENEQVRVEYVSQRPWSAYSRYLGESKSLIQVNMDYPLTVDRILNLACHEGYPGHHVFNLLRDRALVRDARREEFRAQPTFSPQSYLSEGAATYAPTLLLSDDERLRVERDLLFPLAGLKTSDARRYLRVEKLIGDLHTAGPAIARDYLDGNLEFVRAAEALDRETLMQHSETTLLYLNEFRTYMLTYTQGADEVRAYIESGNPTERERWQRYLTLIRDPEALRPLTSIAPLATVP